jgi:phosphopentomutase
VPRVRFQNPGRPSSICRSLGTRSTLADMGQTIANNFGGTIPHGSSFLDQL